MFRYVLASLKFVFSAMFLENPWSSKSFHFQCRNCHTRRLKVKCMDVVSEGRQQGGDTVVQPQGCQWVPLASDLSPCLMSLASRLGPASHWLLLHRCLLCTVFSPLPVRFLELPCPLPGLSSRSPSRCPSTVLPSK